MEVVAVSAQLALTIEGQAIVPAAVWETLPARTQAQVTIALARLFARLIEEAR